MSTSKSGLEAKVALPRRVNLLKFAQGGKTLTGRIELAECDRLADMLSSGQGEVGFRLEGGCDAEGRPTVTIALEGNVPLVCQRCLQPFQYWLTGASTIRVALSAREADEGSDETEAIVAAEPVDLAELIEDELLLCLPYAPKHLDGECTSGGAEETLQRTSSD